MTTPVNRILWFLIGLHTTLAITVSPDVGLRNQSKIEAYQSELPPTDDNGDVPHATEKSERIRRLIPYTTFYIPPGFPIQEFYNLNPIQQQRIAAALSASGSVGPPPDSRDYQQPKKESQITRLKPHVSKPSTSGNANSHPRPRLPLPALTFNLKFPSSRPNYQIIAYNTRHQSSSPPQAMPLYREREPIDNSNNINAIHSAMHHHQHQQEIEHMSPPLSYKQPNMNIPYQVVYQQNSIHKQVFTPFTNKNKLPGSFRPIIYGDPEQVLNQENTKSQSVTAERQKAQQQQAQVVQEGLRATQTPSPIYYEEITRKPVAEPALDLSPQEKYVAFLQEQIQRQTQRIKQQQQNQQQAYADSISTQAPIPQNRPTEKPITEIPTAYAQEVTPIHSSEEIYSQPPQQTQASQSAISDTLRANYLEYLQQNRQPVIGLTSIPPSNQPYNGYNPQVYYTTPQPNYGSSIPPEYREPIIEPLYEAEPVFKIPVKKPPPPVRQHLTETSKNFSPILTSYYTAQQITTPNPGYNSFVAPPRSDKKKAQRHRPTSAPAAIESEHPNTVRFPDEGPPEPPRPHLIEGPESRPEVYQNRPQEELPHYPLLRPDPTPSPAQLHKQQPQSVEPEFEYIPEIVEIPRSKFRPKPRPEMVFKLRPQLLPGSEYRPNQRPSSAYLTQPENKPSFVLRERPQPQSHPYAHIQYQPGVIDSPPPGSRPNSNHVTRLQPQPAQRPDYHPNILEVAHPESEQDFDELHEPERRPQTVLKEQSESTLLVQQPQEQHQYESRPTDSDVIYGHKPDYTENSEPEKPHPVYIPEPEIKPQPEKTAELSSHDSETESTHPNSSPAPIVEEHDTDVEIDDETNENSLAQLLKKLQDTNQLPKTLTPDNIDNSIRTLIKILNNLKQSQTVNEEPPQHQEEEKEYQQELELPKLVPAKKNKPGPSSGRPGIDYPILADIPQTSFNCKEQRYKGFFGDPETGCQAWHYCDLNGGQASFLCPNGTIFSQVALTCDWWFNVKCSTTAQLYVLNERLYKYILPFTPKFPEDYSGPLVDKYLAIKFQEMEEKMRRERLKGKSNDNEAEMSNSAPTNGTQLIDKQPEEEEDSSEEDDDVELGGKSSIDTYSTTQQTPTTEISSNSISSISVSPTQETYESDAFPPASTSTFAAITASGEEIDNDSITDKSKITVESEKAEVIEIKAHGDSGQLAHSHTYVAED